MNSLLRPFSILIILVTLSILSLFVAVSDWHIQVRLYGANKPSDKSSPLSEGRIYQLPSRTTYLTWTDGRTDLFDVNQGDQLKISRPDYQPIVLTLLHLSTTVRELGITLFQNRSNDPRLEGRVIFNGLPLRDVTVSCEGCIETSLPSTTVEDGRYSIPTGRASSAYILHFHRMATEVATIKVEPTSNDDHARIDVAFDDSSPFMNFFRSRPAN